METFEKVWENINAISFIGWFVYFLLGTFGITHPDLRMVCFGCLCGIVGVYRETK